MSPLCIRRRTQSFFVAKNTRRLKPNDKFFPKPSSATALEQAARRTIAGVLKQAKSAEIIAIVEDARIAAKLPLGIEGVMERKEVCAIAERPDAVVNTVIVSQQVDGVDRTAAASIARTNDSSLSALT